jgi:hypothetical protein
VSKKIIGVALILLLWWFSMKAYDTGFFYSISATLKHLINFGLLIAVFLVGYFVLTTTSNRSIIQLWVLMYAILISSLAVVGCIDLISKITTRSLRELIFDVRMFFVSPLPFLVMLLLTRWIDNIKARRV